MNHQPRPHGIGRLGCLSASILITSLSVAAPAETKTTVASAPDGIGPRLTKSLNDVKALEISLDAASLESIRAALGDSAANVEAMGFFVATEELEDGASRSLTIAVVPLGESATTGYATVAVSEDGVAREVDVWGSDDLDADAWGVFAGQFRGRCRVIDGHTALRPSEIDRLVKQYESGKTDDPTRALYRQRLLMRSHSARFTFLGNAGQGGEGPDRQWYQAWADSMEELALATDRLAEVFDDETRASYRGAAETGQEILAKAADARQNENLDSVRTIIRGLYRGSCMKCHQLKSPGLGSDTIYWDVQSSFERLGVRSDLLRVGVDVLAVTDQPERSQEAADGIRAALVVLGAIIESD